MFDLIRLSIARVEQTRVAADARERPVARRKFSVGSV